MASWVDGGWSLVGFGLLCTRMGLLRGFLSCWCTGILTVLPFGMGLSGGWSGGGFGLFGMTFGGLERLLLPPGGRGI